MALLKLMSCGEGARYKRRTPIHLAAREAREQPAPRRTGAGSSSALVRAATSRASPTAGRSGGINLTMQVRRIGLQAVVELRERYVTARTPDWRGRIR